MAIKDFLTYAGLKNPVTGAPSQTQVDTAVDAYLERNPVEPGATTEEAAQIQANKNALENKVDKTGWTADMYLGTDAYGNVVEREAPEGYVKTVNGVGPDSNGNVVVSGTGSGSGQNPTGGGLSTTVANLLIAILRKGYYEPDQTANITALAAALGVTEDETPDVPVVPDEPDNPDTVTYTITNNLTNVVNSNAAASVDEGASYTATLSAVDGYDIDAVTVTMGGVDITDMVYLDGTVNIATVSGDIVITATAKAAPVEVAMYARVNNSYNTTVYSDDGNTSVYSGATTYVASEDVFTEDTEVTVTIETNGAMYSVMYAACYGSGFPASNHTNDAKGAHYAAVLFDTYKEVSKEGTYTKTYVVKAGYGLVLVNAAATAAPITSVTVTK